jgi:uncharacterized membrane protein
MVKGFTPNRDLMSMARESLKNRWGLVVLATLFYFAIFIVCAVAIGILQGVGAHQVVPAANHSAQVIASTTHQPKVVLPLGVRLISYGIQVVEVLITGPLMLGFFAFFLKIARRSQAKAIMVFEGIAFFGKALSTYLLMTVFILLWTLLLVIPGVIAIYSYSMTFFILADDPSVKPMEALRRSKEMMRGKKWKFFFLQCRFIGWYLLSLLTCGIGLLWLVPYFQTAAAHFYEDVCPEGGTTGVSS